MTVSANRKFYLAVFALGLILAVRIAIMAVLPLTDPTEGRYAQISQEMARTGDWVTPRIWMREAHIAFMGKPPLYFWAAAGAVKAFGESEFAVRLPSLLSSLALLCLLYVVMERYGNKGDGLLCVMLASSCLFFLICGGSVAVDMMFSSCVAGSLLAYFAFVSEPDLKAQKRWSLLVFILLGLGFLTKGPAVLVLFGLPVFIWTARWGAWAHLRSHRWLAGGALFLIIVVPWFVICEGRNPGFLKYFFLNENLLRYVTHDYGDAYGSGHLCTRGTAVLMFLAAVAPWSLFAAWWAWRGGKARCAAWFSDRKTSFLFFGFVSGVLFWCLARQLLFTYVLPAIPLFVAWLVLTVQDSGVRRKLFVASASLLVLFSIVGAACVPFVSTMSTTREIVRHAYRVNDAHTAAEPFIFEAGTPYSALFYANGWVVPHPREALGVSVQRFKDSHRSVLVAIETRRKKKLELLEPGSWSELAVAGKWTLIRVWCDKVR